jgi:hypothetical protein
MLPYTIVLLLRGAGTAFSKMAFGQHLAAYLNKRVDFNRRLAHNLEMQVANRRGPVLMATQDEREKEIAAVLKAIYEQYGSNLSKFLGEVMQNSSKENRAEVENVGRAARQYGEYCQTRQKSRIP